MAKTVCLRTGPDGKEPTSIDRFLAVKLQEKGLSFSPVSEKAVWLRRVTLDLTGLPPTEKERATFLADTSTGAKEQVVDRLLSSDAFGERWGRHWLDVARSTSHIVRSKHGLLGSWPGDGKITVSTTLKEVTVVAGESLDFVVQSDGDVEIEFGWKFTV